MHTFKVLGSLAKTLGWDLSLVTLAVLLTAPLLGIMASQWYDSILGGVILAILYVSLISSSTLLMVYSRWQTSGRIDARQLVLLYTRVYVSQTIIAAAAAAISTAAGLRVLAVCAVMWLVLMGFSSLVFYAGLRISADGSGAQDRGNSGNGETARTTSALFRRRFNAAFAGFIAGMCIVIILCWTRAIAPSGAVRAAGVLFLLLLMTTTWLAATWRKQ